MIEPAVIEPAVIEPVETGNVSPEFEGFRQTLERRGQSPAITLMKMTITADIHHSDDLVQSLPLPEKITSSRTGTLPMPLSSPNKKIQEKTPPKKTKSNLKRTFSSHNITRPKKKLKFQEESDPDDPDYISKSPIINSSTSKKKSNIVKNISKITKAKKQLTFQDESESEPEPSSPVISSKHVKSKSKKHNVEKESAKIVKKTSKVNSPPDMGVAGHSGISQPKYKEISGSETESSPSKVIIDERFYKLLRTNCHHIIYRYEGSVRPGMIVKKRGFNKPLDVKTMFKYTPLDKDGNPILHFGRVNPNSWKWPEIDVIHTIEVQDILDRIIPPHLVSSRSVEHHVDKIKKYWTMQK